MKYVQHQLGHSSITMTMDLYTHLLPEVNDKCVNLLNNIVTQTIEPQGNGESNIGESKNSVHALISNRADHFDSRARRRQQEAVVRTA